MQNFTSKRASILAELGIDVWQNPNKSPAPTAIKTILAATVKKTSSPIFIPSNTEEKLIKTPVTQDALLSNLLIIPTTSPSLFLVCDEPGIFSNNTQPSTQEDWLLFNNLLQALNLSPNLIAKSTKKSQSHHEIYLSQWQSFKVNNHQQIAPERVLDFEIKKLNPQFLMILGQRALPFLLQPTEQQQPFNRLRSQMFKFNGIPMAISYSLSQLLRNQPSTKASAWYDWCRALKFIRA